MTERKPRLCFVGNLLGLNDGYITTQGQIVADLFAGENYEVTRVSSKINRAARLAEIVSVLITKRRRFDLVVLDVYSGLNLIMAETVSFLCKLLKLPLVMVLRGGDLPKYARLKPRMVKRILGRADVLIAPSRFLAEKLDFLGFEIKIITNVLNIKAYPFKPRREIEPNLIWMRSFHPLYNPEMAVKVLARLRESHPKATLTMAGVDKGSEPEVKKLADTLGVREAIRFAGFLDLAKKIREFSAADVYLNTNRVDNMPVSVIEARALGLPVVATNVGGLPYLIGHGENGLLVADDDVESMVENVKLLLDNTDLVAKISLNGRKLAEESDWKAVRCEWDKIFSALLKAKKARVLNPKLKTRNAG
jgi:glycosyltransferase involved in cell wall biosynthesis